MLYKIEQHGSEWCVMKADTGESMGCHDSHEKAEAQMRAMAAEMHREEKTADAHEFGGYVTSPTQTTARSVNATIHYAMDKSLVDRFKAWWQETLGGTEPLIPGLKIAGNHFLVVWSNNFEDHDEEIFTEKAIDDYVTRVDSGVVPLPDVWVWHTNAKTRIGVAAWVARHGHFSLAVGEFDEGAPAQRAKAYYRSHLKDTGVSHGFVYPKRAFDGKHYHEFNTFEISLLPRGAEANPYTSLEKVKEMALTPEKRKYLEDVFGEETAKQMLDDLDKRGKALEDIGAAYKEFAQAGPAAANAEAVKTVSADLKAFVADLMADSASVAEYAAGAIKAQQAHKAELEKAFADYKVEMNAKLDAQAQQVASLKELLDMRPRSASKDAATEVDDAKLDAEFKKQFIKRDPFWGTEVVDIGD